MTRPTISAQRHILRALSEWPKDTIRPELQFQKVLQKRFDRPRLDMSEGEQLRQANALYGLLENRYHRKYRIMGNLLAPMATPTHYQDLAFEILAAPNRTALGRLWLRLKGIVRIS